MKYWLNLQYFAEGGGGEGGDAGAGAEAAATETAPAAENAEKTIQAGDTLPNGQKASAQVAAAMNRQMKRNPELRKVYGQTPKAEAQQAAPAADGTTGQDAGNQEKTPEDEWNELKKGRFAEFYGRDVQSAVQDRFKNAAPVQEQLNRLEPALKVLRDRAGVQTNDELVSKIMDDDSLYEEEANDRGMTTAAYKQFMQMEAKMQELERREKQQKLMQHFAGLKQQAENLKAVYPNFDLETELKNPTFQRLTMPGTGISVEDAFYAVHHKELGPQMLAAGMQRAKQQMGQTIQARQNRPAEGAMKARQGAAQVAVDPKKFTKAQREEIKRMAHLHGKVSLI